MPSVVQRYPNQLSLLSPKDLDVSVDGKVVALKSNTPQTVSANNGQHVLSYGSQVQNINVLKPRKAGEEFSFAIQADSHLDQNTSPDVYMETLRNEVNSKPDFMIDLGDTFMTEKHATYTDAISQYRAQHYYMGRVGANAPVFLVLGNHDGEQGWTERNKDGMAEWSAAQREAYFPAKSTYYDLTWGDAQIWVLDPYNFTTEKPARTQNNWLWTLGERQYNWLKDSLSKSTAKYRFVFIHHLVGGQGKDNRGGSEASPFFEWGGKNLDGTDGFKENRPGWAMPIHELLKKYHVDAVFHGHDHMYVKQDRDGIIYQEVPQPSHARGDSTRSAEEYGYKSGTVLGSSGYLRVHISPKEAKVEYVKSAMNGDDPTIADHYEIKP